MVSTVCTTTCKRIIGATPPSDRLFWRGDVLVIRYEGHLGFRHIYRDIEEAVVSPVEEVLRKVYETKGLERVHQENESLRLQPLQGKRFT